MMTPAEREQLRLSLLRFLDGNPTRFGLSSALLLQMSRAEGRHALDAAEVQAELQYLHDKDLVVPVAKTVSPELTCWRITADGRDLLAQCNA